MELYFAGLKSITWITFSKSISEVSCLMCPRRKWLQGSGKIGCGCGASSAKFDGLSFRASSLYN